MRFLRLLLLCQRPTLRGLLCGTGLRLGNGAPDDIKQVLLAGIPVKSIKAQSATSVTVIAGARNRLRFASQVALRS